MREVQPTDRPLEFQPELLVSAELQARINELGERLVHLEAVETYFLQDQEPTKAQGIVLGALRLRKDITEKELAELQSELEALGGTSA